MTNEKIRFEMFKRNMKMWELADKLNISEATITRKFRKELPSDEQKRIMSVIKGVSK